MRRESEKKFGGLGKLGLCYLGVATAFVAQTDTEKKRPHMWAAGLATAQKNRIV